MDSDRDKELIPRRRRSFLSASNAEEFKIIEEVTTTNYEKVVKVLNNLRVYLEDKNEREMATELNWVILKIQSHTLYTYDLSEKSMLAERLSTENFEVKRFIEHLNDFSEENEIFKRNRDSKISKTTRLSKEEAEIVSSKFKSKSSSCKNVLAQKPIEKEEQEVGNVLFFEEKEEELGVLDLHNSHYDFDLNKINDTQFNIFEMKEKVGDCTFRLIGKFAFDATHTTEYLDTSCLDEFLNQANSKYINNPYHNSLHGADVCHSVLLVLLYSQITDIIRLSHYDVISLITASLLHDIGHPGQNNTYQINSFSDLAIFYNDKSVLENYHISESYKLLLKKDTNIFSKFENVMFRNVRKRIIEEILATDMMFHAKIMGYIKNRLVLNNIVTGINSDKIINIESPTFFDDQQEILNFIVHTCDLAHNAKKFDISYKWSYSLYNEFWNQGDLEKSKGLPVSFLCDRNTVDVPKNQIFFIKGIILPNFEVLVDFLPNLQFFKNNIEDNINCWVQIKEKEEELAKASENKADN